MGVSQIPWEDIRMDERLSLRISQRKNNEESVGCELHWHEELELYYVRTGGVSLLSEGQQAWLQPGDVGFVNWCQPHRGNKFLNGTCHYIIQINPSLLARETVLLPDSSERVDLLSLFAFRGRRFPQVFSNRIELTSLLDKSIEEAEQSHFCSEPVLKALALEIAAYLLRESKPGPRRDFVKRDATARKHIQEILAYLSSHYTQPESVTLRAISHHFGLSTSYLCRLFKQQTNLTLTHYISELRCAKAASLLQDGNSPQEVALATGFQDYNYFSRIFKKIMGTPPSTYCGNPPAQSASGSNPEIWPHVR